MIEIFQQYIPTIQKYLLAENKVDYLNSLKPQSKQRKVLQLLIQPLEADIYSIKEKFKYIGIPQSKADKFIQQKIYISIKNRKSKQEVMNVLQLIMKQKGSDQFSHAKPIDIVNPHHKEVSQNKISSEANFIDKFQGLIQEKMKIVLLIKSLYIFSNYGIKKISQETLLNLEFKVKENFLSDRLDLLSTYDDQFVVKFIFSYYQQKRQKENPNYRLCSTILKSLTKSQLSKILTVIPDLINDITYIQFWFKQHYVQRLDIFGKNSALSFSQKEQKRKVLVEIRQALKNINTMVVRSLQEQTLMELLILDLSLENPKKQIFIQFLENMYIPCNNLSKVHNEKVNRNWISNNDMGSQWHNTHKYEMVGWNHQKIINQYLIALFKIDEEPQLLCKTLEPFIDYSHVQKTCIKVRLTNGQTINNLNILDNSQLIELRDKKKISILSKNKKIFKVDEDVVLTIRVKNIKNIKVKIYQLSLEKSYLQKQTKIDENMNLSFLEPTKSFDYEVQNSNPFKQSLYDLPIKEIEKKQAMYIIELQGDRVSSRAIIRKGAIVCLNRTTLAGIQLKFYDEEGKRIKQLDLWVNSKKVRVNESYTIPFGNQYKNLNLIAVKNDFAELINVNVSQQKYSWKIGYIFGHESFIVGNKAKIVVHPRLQLNDEQIGLKILKDSKISVQVLNNQDIKSYYSFNNIEWSSKQDYVLQFPIQSYIKNITINIESQITLYSGEKFLLKDIKSIHIDLNQDNSNFIDIYLRKDGVQNYLYLIGQNGQPIPNTDLNVQVSFRGITQSSRKLLRTSNQGFVKLGLLNLATSINATLQSQSGKHIYKKWRINDIQAQVNYTDVIHYKKGQMINLPVPSKTIMQNVVILKKGIEGLISANVSQFAKIKNSRLKIEGLQTGSYQIYLLELEKRINLVILGGKQWQAANQVYDCQKQMVYEIFRSANHLLSLGQAEITESEDEIGVKVKLNLPQCGLSESNRAHVLIYNYQSPQILSEFRYSDFIKPPKTISQKFALKQNQYFNNKTLSDQGCYVENRQSEKKFIGNNLQKPRIFLKRCEVRSTTQQQQVLNRQTGYYPSVVLTDIKTRESDIIKAKNFNYIPSYQIRDISSHNNFIGQAGIMNANIRGDELSFNIPKGYNHFQIYLLSSDGAIKKNYYLNSAKQVGKKDLRHVGIKDSDESQGWTMSREVYHVHKGDKLKISRNSVWSTVGLTNIASYAQIKSSKVPNWVVQWTTYSEQKKIQTYGKNMCHQLNSFIKQNDQKFFIEVVKPFIKNKIIKTVVDLCLLEDEKSKQYSSIQKLQQLNDFQKILLIKYLVSHGDRDRAKQIAKAMELKQKLNKIAFDWFKKQFDTVINSKKTDSFFPPPQNLGALSYQNNRNFDILGQQISPYVYTTSCNPYLNAPQTNRGYVPQQQMMYVHQVQQFSNFSNVGYIPPITVHYPISDRNNLVQIQQNKAEHRYQGTLIKNFKQDINQQEEQLKLRQNYKKGFKPIQKTKQYIETTYKGVKNQSNSKDLVRSSSFWPTLALHLIENPQKNFLTDKFMYLASQRQFTLAMCFIKNALNPDYEMINEGQSLIIDAKNSFSIFVKEVRPTKYVKKFGVMINQRFFDPFDRYTYQQDGTSIERQVDEFIARKIYSLQTVVTNTSGTYLQLQMLLDVPQGSIPLQSHEYTQIKSVNIPPYSTSSFDRSFYFPYEGKFSFYPGNACRGKEIISKAQNIPLIEVKLVSTARKMQSFNDIIRLGNENDVLQFLSNKNIFDQKIFNANSILWMLKNKAVYEKVLKILRSRCYFNESIWMYALYHKDVGGVCESIYNVVRAKQNHFSIPIFQYFPYYCSRTHKFLNQSKSTIRNVQFKNNYHKFIITTITNQTSQQKLAFIYYLLLQDRIDEASSLFKRLSQQDRNAYQLQSDYFECFLDMYEGYPSFVKARKISASYINYPIIAWKNLFKEVYDLLNDFDSVSYVQEQAKTQYQTIIIKEPSVLRVSIPPSTKIEIYIFPINLELYFSQFPFSQFKGLSAVKPFKSITYAAGPSREEQIQRPQQAKDIIVEIYQSVEGKPSTKIDSYHWTHPDLKVKINEKKGNAQVFFKGKHCAGCYCKVYQSGPNGQKFYRDGYTDITGTFKYVLADFENITKFKILFITDNGGVSMEAKPPTVEGFLQ